MNDDVVFRSKITRGEEVEKERRPLHMNCESVTASEHVGAPLSLDKGALGVVP